MGHYGIVYIARNDQHPPNVYKIGGASRDVDERMIELSRETATYGTFEAKAFFPVTDWERAEASCHNQLYEYRDDKEFFKASYNELLDVVRNVCEDYQPEAYADKPTDGMSKALFLEPAKPPHYDPLGLDKMDWGNPRPATNGTVESQHKAEKKKDRDGAMDGVNSFLLDDKKMFIVWALLVIFITVCIFFLPGMLIKINEPNALACRSETQTID